MTRWEVSSIADVQDWGKNTAQRLRATLELSAALAHVATRLHDRLHPSCDPYSSRTVFRPLYSPVLGRLPVLSVRCSAATVALIFAFSSFNARSEEPEHGTARVGYGFSYRRGSQTDSGPGLSYKGYSPNNIWAEGWYFRDWWGAAAYVERESYALLDASGRVTGGTLWRGNVGPAFRIKFWQARVELMASYAAAALPLYTNSATPVQVRPSAKQ